MGFRGFYSQYNYNIGQKCANFLDSPLKTLPLISIAFLYVSGVASQHRVTKALHDFSNWIVHRSMDGLTNRVYQGINYFTFRNRNRNRIRNRNRNDHRRKPIKQKHEPKLMAYDEDYYMDYVENYENYGYDY